MYLERKRKRELVPVDGISLCLGEVQLRLYSAKCGQAICSEEIRLPCSIHLFSYLSLTWMNRRGSQQVPAEVFGQTSPVREAVASDSLFRLRVCTRAVLPTGQQF